MTDFNATLLRERFVIKDRDDGEPIIAVGNRLDIPLDHSWERAHEDKLVIRSKTMHGAAYFGARIVEDYRKNGPVFNRQTDFNWDQAYKETISGYDRNWIPDNWCAVYHEGAPIYQYGKDRHHSFLDVIEQCDIRNTGEYEQSVNIAKDAFAAAEKNVTIEHEANVAMILNLDQYKGKSGLIIRGPEKKTTFNMGFERRGGQDIRPAQSLNVSGAYLEGFQLAFFIGFSRQKLNMKLISSSSLESEQYQAAKRRLDQTKDRIEQYEKMLGISYRPEKPNFPRIIYDTEQYADGVLKKQIAENAEKNET